MSSGSAPLRATTNCASERTDSHVSRGGSRWPKCSPAQAWCSSLAFSKAMSGPASTMMFSLAVVLGHDRFFEILWIGGKVGGAFELADQIGDELEARDPLLCAFATQGAL